MDSKAIEPIMINVPSGVLWVILLIAILIFSLLSWVLVHHWNYYGIKGNNKIFAKSLYFVGAISLFVLSVLLLGSYDFL